MNTKNAGDKLQRGYHAMVESIETLIKKEGASLKQALETAEEKIEEWEDLSADQYKHIKNEVRHDLHSLGHKLDDAKTSFKHRLEMDTMFMKKSAINKLSSIADATSNELIELKDSLLPNKGSLTMNEKAQAEHFDHKRWHNDHSFWITEITLWRKEVNDAEAKILAIHDAVNKHGKSLQSHVKEIRIHDQATHDHEVKLSELEKTRQDNNDENSEDRLTHEQLNRLHDNHALLHQQFKNKHREIMILVERLHDLTQA